LNTGEVLKSSASYEVLSQKMLGIFDAMGLYEIGVSGIDPSPLASVEELITFQLEERQEHLVIIQVVSNEIFSKIAKLKTPHDIWIYIRTSYRRESTLFYIFVLRSFMPIEQRISLAKVSPSEFISAFETEWNRIAHLSQSSAAGSSPYRKIVEDLLACHEAKRDFCLPWFAESHDNVMENLSSDEHLSYHKAKEHILNLASNDHSPSDASSKNSEPQHEANAFSSSTGQKYEKK
jgi:hypothetical protein